MLLGETNTLAPPLTLTDPTAVFQTVHGRVQHGFEGGQFVLLSDNGTAYIVSRYPADLQIEKEVGRSLMANLRVSSEGVEILRFRLDPIESPPLFEWRSAAFSGGTTYVLTDSWKKALLVALVTGFLR